MFAKFDRDGNGLIDRDEFRAVARTMRASSRRREVLSVATASFGSVFVASGSSTFQFAQKRFRSAYLEEYAEAAQAEMFPTAMLSGDLDRAVARVLRSRGFAPENTLFGHSVCADEVNNRREQLLPLMVNRWQEGEISEISAHFVFFVSLLKISIALVLGFYSSTPALRLEYMPVVPIMIFQQQQQQQQTNKRTNERTNKVSPSAVSAGCPSLANPASGPTSTTSPITAISSCCSHRTSGSTRSVVSVPSSETGSRRFRQRAAPRSGPTRSSKRRTRRGRTRYWSWRPTTPRSTIRN
jgi:hypothetical protein